MTYIGRLLVVTTILITSSIALAVSARAAGFSVTPVFPDNQRPESRGAFNLDVYPGQEQVIHVMVNNPREESISVEVNLISPGTNRNGFIDYTGPGVLDESILGRSFSDIASLTVYGNITIPPRMSAEVPILIRVPEDFEGVMLGAVHVLLGLTDEDLEGAGMIINRFAHVVAVQMQYYSGVTIPIDFALSDVGLELINYRAAIVANIRNPQERFAMGALAHSRIYLAGSTDPIFIAENRNVDFAPNSVFPLTLTDDLGIGIPPGEYVALIQVEYNGLYWDFEETFIVEAQTAAVINTAAINQQQAPVTPAVATVTHAGLPGWVMMAIGAGGVLTVVVFSALILKVKSANKKAALLYEQAKNVYKADVRGKQS